MLTALKRTLKCTGTFLFISLAITACSSPYLAHSIDASKWLPNKRVLLVLQLEPTGGDMEFQRAAFADFGDRLTNYLSQSRDVKVIHHPDSKAAVIAEFIWRDYVDLAKKEGFTSIMTAQYAVLQKIINPTRILYDPYNSTLHNKWQSSARIRIFDEYGDRSIANVPVDSGVVDKDLIVLNELLLNTLRNKGI